MKAIDSKILKKFLKLAAETLKGDWLLVGGTVLPALGHEYRVTTDIDLVSLKNSSQSESLKLMEIAEKLGLPIESINQAAAFFVHKQLDLEKHLIELQRGKKAVIYRPDGVLFLRLKTARMTETDLDDCLRYLKIDATLDRKLAIKDLKKELGKETSDERRQRLARLLDGLEN